MSQQYGFAHKLDKITCKRNVENYNALEFRDVHIVFNNAYVTHSL